MRISGQTSGTSEFTLDIRSYQFPNAVARDDQDWDPEWLHVEGSVSTPKGHWKFSDACLTTFELETLAHWFRDLAAGKAPAAVDFTEPNLRFARQDESVVIWFSQEASPPWATEDERFGDGVPVLFQFRKEEIDIATLSMAELVMKFPMRNGFVLGSDSPPERPAEERASWWQFWK